MAKAEVTKREIVVSLELNAREAMALHALLGATCGTTDEVSEIWNTLDEIDEIADNSRRHFVVLTAGDNPKLDKK